MKIYTQSGDEGLTGLFGNERLPKHHVRIHAIGDVDELNATIGSAILQSGQIPELSSTLSTVQNRLFDVGSELACDPSGDFQMISILPGDIEFLETEMDRLDSTLPELKNFILPGGSELAARLHLARVVCRRAERVVLALNDRADVRSEVRIYLNRLSDYLFMAARYANMKLTVDDTVWNKRI